MKKLALLGMSIALALSAAPASALTADVVQASVKVEHICYNLGISQNRCLTIKNGDVNPALRIAKYPSQIVVKSKRDWQKANAGWTFDRNCYRPSGEIFGVDHRIDQAKFIYCEFNKRGYSVPKPELVKGYK